jgi:hypothetical protein
MTDTLRVVVNDEPKDVPNTVSTRSEFMDAVGYADREFNLYRIDGGNHVEINGELMVFDKGDEFVIVPSTVAGGGA